MKEIPQSFSMRQIASKANIAVGTIYHYFPGKVDLIAAILLEDWKRRYFEAQKQVLLSSSLMACLKSSIVLSLMSLRAMILPPRQAWTGISNCCLGITFFSFSTVNTDTIRKKPHHREYSMTWLFLLLTFSFF